MTPSLSGFPPALIRRLVIKIGSALLVGATVIIGYGNAMGR